MSIHGKGNSETNMRKMDWNGNIYNGRDFPLGYRVNILPQGENDNGHKSGGIIESAICPNCTRHLFAAFKFNNNDPRIRKLKIWNDQVFPILVCPACALYMEPYWVIISGNNEIKIIGGERDGGEILQDIETPYEERCVSLTELLPSEYPTHDDVVESFVRRTLAPGVYHQLGGLPSVGGYVELDCCECGSLMKFAGIVDYDDQNIPLYENDHQPVALIIGDGDRLHIFTCIMCNVIGLKWNH
jgi:hypothetical protein